MDIHPDGTSTWGSLPVNHEKVTKYPGLGGFAWSSCKPLERCPDLKWSWGAGVVCCCAGQLGTGHAQHIEVRVVGPSKASADRVCEISWVSDVWLLVPSCFGFSEGRLMFTAYSHG